MYQMKLNNILTIVLSIFLLAYNSSPVQRPVNEPEMTLSTIIAGLSNSDVVVADPDDPAGAPITLTSLSRYSSHRIQAVDSQGNQYRMCTVKALKNQFYDDFFTLDFQPFGSSPLTEQEIQDLVNGGTDADGNDFVYYVVVRSGNFISCFNLDDLVPFNIYRNEDGTFIANDRFEFDRITGIEANIGDPQDDETVETIFGKFKLTNDGITGLSTQIVTVEAASTDISNNLNNNLGNPTNAPLADGSLHGKLKLANNRIESLESELGNPTNSPLADGSVHGKLKLANQRIESLSSELGIPTNAPLADGSVHGKLKLANQRIESLSSELGIPTNAPLADGSVHGKLKLANNRIESVLSELGSPTDAADAAGSVHAKISSISDQIDGLSGSGSGVSQTDIDNINSKLKELKLQSDNLEELLQQFSYSIIGITGGVLIFVVALICITCYLACSKNRMD